MKNKNEFLRLADDVDQTKAMEYALAFIEKREPDYDRPIVIFDIAKHASVKRLHIFDANKNTIDSMEAAHGAGSEGNKNDGYATEFSNENNSHMSSLGMYKTGKTYEGKHGESLRLIGLESTNSAAEKRAVVMHGADYVGSGKEAGDSWGCPAVSMKNIQRVIDLIKGGAYLYIYYRTANDVGDTVETLKEGSSGKAVNELQKELGLTVDGSFGPKTKAAVVSFQLKHGLVADGIVGEKTWAKLRTEPVPEVKPEVPAKPDGLLPLWYPKANRSIPGKMKIRGKYKKGWPEGAIVHWTSGHCETEKNGENSVKSCIRDQSYAYFVIGPAGVVYQNFPLNEWGYHAGTSKWPGLPGTVSDELVGIEVCCAGKVKGPKNTSWFGVDYAADRCRTVKSKDNVESGTYVKYTEAQEKALEELLLWLHAQAPSIFKLDFILGHDSVAPGRKSDPGGSLSMTIPEYQKYLKEKSK